MDELFSYLDRLIATSGILYNKIKDHHWNMMGAWTLPFLHEWVDGLAEDMEDFVDEMAEHVRILDLSRHPVSTVREWLLLTEINELDSREIPRDERLQIIHDDYLHFRQLLQEGLDMTTLLDQQDLNGKLQNMQIQIGKAIWYSGGLLRGN